jgi:D-alanyl-D-alanine endopeptidase (penicillin-binding protein 7)
MIRTLGWTLVHFLWQGAAIASLLAGLNLALRRGAPQLRYALACFGLLLMLASPVVTFRALGGSPAFAPEPPVMVVVGAGAATGHPTPEAHGALNPAGLGRGVDSLLPSLVALWAVGVWSSACARSAASLSWGGSAATA